MLGLTSPPLQRPEAVTSLLKRRGKIKKELSSIFAIISPSPALLLLVLLLLAWPLLFQSLALASLDPVQITNDPANQGRPDVGDDVIVWKSNQAGNWDIYMYAIHSGITSAVSTDPADQNVPVTNGRMIFWQDERNGDEDVYMKDLLTGIEQPLIYGPGNQGMPAVSGNLLVYVDDANGHNEIYVMDLTTRQIQQVSSVPSNKWQPRISGTKVVWQDNRAGRGYWDSQNVWHDYWDIWEKDLAGGPEQPVCDDVSGSHTVADIDGNRVVWQEYRNGQYDIWMKDLTGGDPEPVTDDAAYQNSPRISGDLIVWEDYRNGDYDIYMKDLTSNNISSLATGPSTQARPAIDKETVVWEATGSTGYDVWMTKIPDETPPTTSNLAPANGSFTSCEAPVIAANYSDNRVGIDVHSVQLSLDGNDITSSADITEASVSYQPSSPLADGSHTVSLSVSDKSGNRSTTVWQFSISPVMLSLNLQKAYWATLDDYASRLLSVQYNIAAGADAAALQTQLLASQATAGVVLASQTPVPIGDIQPGGKADVVVKYMVPPGVMTFKAKVYAAAHDACDINHYYPGPPPGE